MKMIKMDQGLFKIIYETLCYTRTIPDKRKVKKNRATYTGQMKIMKITTKRLVEMTGITSSLLCECLEDLTGMKSSISYKNSRSCSGNMFTAFSNDSLVVNTYFITLVLIIIIA